MKQVCLLFLAFVVFSFALSSDEKEYNLGDFDSIRISNSADVYISFGKTNSVKVKGTAEQIERLDLKVEKNSLKVKSKKIQGIWNPKKAVEVYITMPNLEEISIAGSGDCFVKGNFDLDDLYISIAGSGDVELKGGSIDDLDISIAGSGDVNCDMIAENADVSIAGSGDVELTVRERLDVSVVGSGDVFYHGNPGKVDVSSLGSGEVIKR